MRFGKFNIKTVNFGNFRLDGGSMFGSVPKNLWSRKISCDAENCIPLATRCLLVEFESKLILVDVGNGDKWSEKEKQIFAIDNISLASMPFDRKDITDIVLTHLHFDHAGGISSYDKNGILQPNYPQAQLYLQRDNLINAKSPSVKEKASYLSPNVEPVEKGNLRLLSGSCEILPGFWVHQVDGHTKGQQWIEIKGPEASLVYPTDLIPTSHHIPLPYHMGYDACASTLLREKASFLEAAVKNKWIIVFEHDCLVPAVTVKHDERGAVVIDHLVEIAD